jgi:hypothetical protein
MKRWQNIAAISGFSIIVAFVVMRLLRAHTSWADLREFVPGLAGVGLTILMIAAVLLVIVWCGYLLWCGFRQGVTTNRLAEPQYSFAARFWLVSKVAVLSVILALAAGFLSRMRSPGWLIAISLGFWAGSHRLDLNLGFMLLLIVGVDSAMSFAILWGVYLLWLRLRR